MCLWKQVRLSKTIDNSVCTKIIKSLCLLVQGFFSFHPIFTNQLFFLAVIDWFTHSKVSSGFPEFIKGNELFSSTNRFFEGGSLDVKVHFNSIFIIDDAEG